jgi:hypothetical protein
MRLLKIALLTFSTVFLLCGMGHVNGAMGQSADQTTQPKKVENEINFDTQLYLIVGTDQEVSESRMPPVLEPIIKQLRNTLPFKNYRVSATLINRVKNDGRLSLKWIGGPLLGSASGSALTRSFNEFDVHTISLVQADNGQQLVRLEGFRFGSRVPIQTATAVASNGPVMPVINYESTGLNTDISMRENEPVIVGTVNVGPSGEAIILVMSARRTNK